MSVHTLNRPEVVKGSLRKETEYYRGYNLSVQQDREKYIGEVFNGDIRLAYCEAESNESSLLHLRDIVDNLIREKTKKRRNALPTISELHLAIEKSSQFLPNPTRKLTEYIRIQGRIEYPLEELMLVSDSTNTTEVTLRFAELGRLLCDLVGFEPIFVISRSIVAFLLRI